MTSIFEIAAGESRARIAPGLGGSLLSWTCFGQPMLRSTSAAAVSSGDRLGLASFPLVPFSNRIGSARFRHNHELITLRPNFAPEPHAIHGTGWEDCWSVAEHTAEEIILTLEHCGDSRWPWPFTAHQRISVTEDSLTLSLSATNTSDHPAPLAFGHHPYFDSDGAMLQFQAGLVWLNGADMLPTERADVTAELDFSTAAAVGGREIDHCYSGWAGSAQINWEGRTHALRISSDLNAATVYIPLNTGWFCFEPVPHSNNALNRSDAAPPMPVIAPGDVFTGKIAMHVVPA